MDLNDWQNPGFEVGNACAQFEKIAPSTMEVVFELLKVDAKQEKLNKQIKKIKSFFIHDLFH